MKKLLTAFVTVLAVSGCVYYHSPKPGALISRNGQKTACEGPLQCAETYYMTSALKLKNGDLDGAISDIKKSIGYDPASAYLHLTLARMYEQKQDLPRALEEVGRSLKLKPDDLPALYTKADIYADMNKTTLAIGILKHVVAVAPDSEDAYIALALTQYHARDVKGAQDTLKEMAVRIPDSPYSYYYLAKIAVDMKQYQSAIRYYGDAVKASPDFYSAFYEQADMYAYLKEYDRAISVYRKLLSRSPDDYGLYEKIGDLYVSGKKYKDALKSYRMAEGGTPSLVLQLKIGMVYIELKQYRDAESTFKAIIGSNPTFYRAYYYYGILLSENKKYDKALNVLGEIPPSDDTYRDAVIQRAVIYSNRHNNKEAEKVLLPLVRKNPTADIFNLYASFFAQDKDYKQAIGILNKALDKFTDSQSVLYHLGVLYDQSGDTDSALSVMHQILNINKHNAEALNYIGYTYADKGIKLNTAEKLIKQALKIKPKDGYITDSLGWVYYKKGLFKKAIGTLKKAVKLSKGDPQILTHLGDAYLKAGHALLARDTYTKALNSSQLKDKKLKRELKEKLQKLGRK